MRRKVAAGNWKMNGLKASIAELEALKTSSADASCDVIICPPATLVAAMADVAGDIVIGGQDCHWNETGAHTGDISAEMLKDAGAGAVILGHSERAPITGKPMLKLIGKRKQLGAQVCKRLFVSGKPKHSAMLAKPLML